MSSFCESTNSSEFGCNGFLRFLIKVLIILSTSEIIDFVLYHLSHFLDENSCHLGAFLGFRFVQIISKNIGAM